MGCSPYGTRKRQGIFWDVRTKQKMNLTFSDRIKAACQGTGLSFAVLVAALVAGSTQVYAASASAAGSSEKPVFGIDRDLARFSMPGSQNPGSGFQDSSLAKPGFLFTPEASDDFLRAGSLTLGCESGTGAFESDLTFVTAAGSPMVLRDGLDQAPPPDKPALTPQLDSCAASRAGVGGNSMANISWAAFPALALPTRNSPRAAPAMDGLHVRLGDMSDIDLGYKSLAAFPSGASFLGTHALAALFTVKF